MDLTGDLEMLRSRAFVLKEGVDYRVKVSFKVNREIVCGLRCLHLTYRRGRPGELMQPLHPWPPAEPGDTQKSLWGCPCHRHCPLPTDAPWCGHCQRLAPAFAQAAAALRDESSPARLGKVDATAQTALANEFGITSYPTLKLFRDGNRTHPLPYTGRMDAKGIVGWMQRRAGPSATLLQDPDTAATFVDSQDLVVVGFFKDLESEAAQVFYEVAGDVVDMPFGVAEAAELFEAYGLSADTVCLFKKFDEGRTDFPVDPARGLDAAELTQLLRVHRLELVMEFTNETSDHIFGAKIPHHMLLFLNKSSSGQLQLRDDFRAAAGTFRGKVLFVVVDVAGYGADVLPFFGLTPADAPTLRLVKMENNRKYQMDQDVFSETAIRTFVQAVLDGKVKPRLLSAEPPEDWDTRPVKVLVGKTFEQVAYDETKNVFVKFSLVNKVILHFLMHCTMLHYTYIRYGEGAWAPTGRFVG
ncbi:protein disulfide-isomerase a2 [Limosa lapponica baueri]|uniref:protein disulfide-isomerase n=1 Tax=Limosa lapponica baueri TaxID=1758121 RepID=A0A2I0T682_LIMLA|nr:protein disulfide-isomerase a2 [Limosa lapponica baueri]